MSCTQTGGPSPVLGLVLLTAGVLLALDRLELLVLSDIGGFWPLLLVAIGAIMIMGAIRPAARSAGPGAGPPRTGQETTHE